MIAPALVCALALLVDRERLLGELEYIALTQGGCEGGGPGSRCTNRKPCATCVARYAIAGWQLHIDTREIF